MRALLTVLFTALWTTCASAAAPPVLDRFPIVAWGGPITAEADFNAYRDALFSVVQVPAGNAEALAAAARLDLRAMIVEPQSAGGSPKDWAAAAQSSDVVMGWLLGNLVRPEQVAPTADLIRQLREADPRRWPLVSGPASSDADWETLFGPLVKAGLPALCYQRFAFRADGTTDADGFYSDLEVTRRISVQTGVPVWGMIQVARRGAYRWASPSDLRLQVYSYLAGGAKGLCYFTQWPTLSELATAAPDEGEETPDEGTLRHRKDFSLENIGQINKEIMTLAPALLTLKSTGLFFVGAVPKGLTQLPVTQQPLQSVVAEQALVGTFTDAQERPWALIVNRRQGKLLSAGTLKSTMQVFVGPQVKRVVEIDRYNAYEKTIPIEQGSFYITIPGGTGSLLRLETDAKTAAPTP